MESQSVESSWNIVQVFMDMALLGSSWVLWLLVILSILSVAVIIERSVFYSRMKIDFTSFSQRLGELMSDKRFDEARDYCSRNPAIEAQVALRGFNNIKKSGRDLEQLMTGYLISQRQQLDRGLVVLGTLGNNAPFIGLFGTVIGIIVAFNDLGLNPAGGPSVVMSGISEALVATAVGLMVAIPAVIAFNVFTRIVKRRMANADAIIRLVISSQN